MFDGVQFNLNQIGFFFWFIIFGLLIVIFSIIYRPEFVFMGLSICLYGMVAFLVDLLFDRIFLRSARRRHNGNEIDLSKICNVGHVLRFISQISIIFLLGVIINCKYHFV